MRLTILCLLLAATLTACGSGGHGSSALRTATSAPLTATARPTVAPSADATSTSCGTDMLSVGRSYEEIGLLNATSGWVFVDQRLKWTDDAGATWRDITPSDLEPSDAKFDSGELAFFLDDSTGWVLATRAHAYGVPSDLFIWRTTDGGLSWQKTRLDGPADDPEVAPPLFGPQTLQFVDAHTGWFVIAGASGNMGGTAFYMTTDGGKSWHLSSRLSGYNGSYGPVHFANANDGWEAWDNGGTMCRSRMMAERPGSAHRFLKPKASATTAVG